MSEIVWAEPPFSGGGHPHGKYKAALSAVRERPGEWAMIGRHSSQTAVNIKRGLVAGAERGEFDAVGRNQKDGKADIYVRYIGTASTNGAS